MRDILKICAYLAATVLLGALLAPLIFWAGKAAVDMRAFEGITHPAAEWLRDKLASSSFQRYFNRAVLVAAVVLFFPFLRWLRIGGWGQMGLRKNRDWWKHAGLGFATACGLLLALGFILLILDFYVRRSALPLGDIGEIAVSAVAVGLLEEAIFRGGMMGLAMRTASKRSAWIGVAVLFAVLHFLQAPSRAIDETAVTWLSGFDLITMLFHKFADPRMIVAEFLTLLAVGLALGWFRLRTSSLWICIGLHAGWVFGLKFFSAFTRRGFKPGEMLPWLGESLKIGVVPLLVIAATAVSTAWILRMTTVKTLRLAAMEGGNEEDDEPGPGEGTA